MDVDTVSSVLSFVTVLSCVFLKIPQIFQIVSTRSVAGVSLQPLIMEITGYTIQTLYNYTHQYTIMTYLEYPIILVQVYIMVFFVLKFKQLLNNTRVITIILAYFTLIMAFAVDVVPKEVLTYLLPICTPLSGSAKVMYMYAIIKAKNAEAVSLVTWYISILTNLSRIYTTYMDSSDFKLIFNFIISACLSGAVFITAFYYQWKRATSDVRRPSRGSHAHTD